MSAKIISISNTKGGCGKSTLTLFLAKSLSSQLNKKVLVLDMDQQQSIAELHKLDCIENKDRVLFDVKLSGNKILKNQLNENVDDYDFILIDPPRYTDKDNINLAAESVKFSDYVLIPLNATLLDINASLHFIDMVKKIQSMANDNDHIIEFKAVINRFSDRVSNQHTIEFLNSREIPLFENHVKDLALLQNVDCYLDVLKNKAGAGYLAPFFMEFLKWTKI